MVIEILLVALVFLFCLTQGKTSIICLFVFLLPVHLTMKQVCVLMGGGSLWALWYDIAIFVLLFKTLLGSHSSIPLKSGIAGYLILAFFCFCMSYFSTPRDPESLSTFRSYLHCIALFVSFSSIKFTAKDVRKIYSVLLYSTIFNCVAALIIYFNFQLEWHILLNQVEFTVNGIQYSSPSFLIMGIERLNGFLCGPNQFGAYISVMIVLLLMLKPYAKPRQIPYNICLLLSFCCLILSFARAGWAIVFIFVSLKSIFSGNIKKLVSFAGILVSVLSLSVLVLYIASPDLFTVVVSTFNGEESSAAGRQENVMNGLWEIVSTPWGHGLGSGLSEKGAPVAESSLVILLYELGILGVVYYFAFISLAVAKVRKWEKSFTDQILSFALASLIICVVSLTIVTFPNIYYFWLILGFALNPSFKLIRMVSKLPDVSTIKLS